MINVSVYIARVFVFLYRALPDVVRSCVKKILKKIDRLFSADHFYLNVLGDMHEDADSLREYKRLIIDKFADLEKVNIGCVVTKQYIFDFLICYYSIVESWTFFPYVVHVFTTEKDTRDEISAYRLPNCEVCLIKDVKSTGDWRSNVALKIKMVAHSNLEKCIITDVDNVFLSEVPELFFLLENHDFVFIGCPDERWMIQASLWGFRRSEESVKFAELWYQESLYRPFSEASGLPFAIYKNRFNTKIKVKTLILDKPQSAYHYPSPYNVQANCRPFELEKDDLGFKEKQMGRVKVLHLGGLRCDGNNSVSSRMDVLNARFPECRNIFEYYTKIANRAAKKMGKQTLGFLE